MKKQKIKLSQLETLLMDVADILRGKMDAAQYKEYIFGMLFLKRMSDEFDEKRAEIRKKYKHLPPENLSILLEDKTTYGETFFVPPRARWNEGFVDENGEAQPAIKHLKNNVGDMLNKALAALEDSNETLQGIFKDRINFNNTLLMKAEKKADNSIHLTMLYVFWCNYLNRKKAKKYTTQQRAPVACLSKAQATLKNRAATNKT